MFKNNINLNKYALIKYFVSSVIFLFPRGIALCYVNYNSNVVHTFTPLIKCNHNNLKHNIRNIRYHHIWFIYRLHLVLHDILNPTFQYFPMQHKRW